MIYRFIDDKGTFILENPASYKLYLPLTNRGGSLLSSISPNLAGDIKRDNEHFLTPPASIEDIRTNLLCRRDFFIKTEEQILRLSSPSDDTLEVGLLYQKIIKRTKALDIEILSFIPYNLAAEVMWIKIKNRTKKKLKIIPTSFIPLYGRSEKNLRDHRHVSSLLNRIKMDKYGIYLKPTMVFDEKGHIINKMIYFVRGYEDKKHPPLGQFPTLDAFCGEGDLISPDAIVKNITPFQKKLLQFDGKEACAAFRFSEKVLKPGQETSYFLIMGMEEEQGKIKDIFFRLNSSFKIEKSLEETKKYWLNYLCGLDFDFKDRNFNNWLLWVKLQPTLRKLFGCSFLPHFDYGKGGRGWRDLWQDALTLILQEPDKAGGLILNNFKGVRIDGSNATIITKEGNFISDRNRINRVWMDHAIWPYLALRAYINRAGDLGILLHNLPYFQDHQQDYLLRTKKKKIYKGTLLEHVLVEHLVQFFNVGRHNVIRLENADWNDGLDMAAQEGESAAFSFMYAHNLRDLSNVLAKLKSKQESITVLKELGLLLDRLHSPINYSDYKEKQKRLGIYLEKAKNISGEKIEIKIDDLIRDLKHKSESLFTWLRQKEWVKEAGFFNGYYDNRRKRVEGRLNNKIRMILTSQVFAIMSGGASDGQIKKIWVSLKKYLQDKKLGGFRLNTDFGALCPALGRAFSFSYGDKENGAFFNHMVVMLANALYKRGFIKEAFKVIDSIYKMASHPRAAIYPMIPEYFNCQGKGLYLYLTGSASWYIYTLIEEILGIKFIWGDIILEPKLVSGNFFKDNIEVKFNLGKKIIKVTFIRKQRKEGVYRIREVLLEDKKIIPCDYRYIIKKETLRKIKKKEINLKIYLV